MADAYPANIPAKVVISHKGVFTSNGKVTTGAANTEYQFVTDEGVNITTGNSLTVTAVGNDINIKVNDQTRKIFIPSGNSLTLDGVNINKMTVVENGVDLSFVGGYYR